MTVQLQSFTAPTRLRLNNCKVPMSEKIMSEHDGGGKSWEYGARTMLF